MNAKARELRLATVQTRFEMSMQRHVGILWNEVRARLDRSPEALKSLQAMELTGGEPDVVGKVSETGHIRFHDGSGESRCASEFRRGPDRPV
jgi:hypothetical protein